MVPVDVCARARVDPEAKEQQKHQVQNTKLHRRSFPLCLPTLEQRGEQACNSDELV